MTAFWLRKVLISSRNSTYFEADNNGSKMPRPILSPEQHKASVEVASQFIFELEERANYYLGIGQKWGYPDVENPEAYRKEISESVLVLAEHMRIFNLTEITWEADTGEQRRGRVLGWGFNFNPEEFSIGVTARDESQPTGEQPVPFASLRSIGGISLSELGQAPAS
jgi:hypothetical protein